MRYVEINGRVSTLLEQIENRKNNYYIVLGETPETCTKIALFGFLGNAYK